LPGRLRPRPTFALWTNRPRCFIQTEEGDIKRLQDVEPAEFRLRVGAYRVRFHDHGDTIEILAVKNRSQAYR
jgi:mRNA-degrading endonuclease RelE of RelBE toxin-antitoxin system